MEVVWKKMKWNKANCSVWRDMLIMVGLTRNVVRLRYFLIAL